MTGAGVATATPIQIKAESANPASAAIFLDQNMKPPRDAVRIEELGPDDPDALIAVSYLRLPIYEYNQRNVNGAMDFLPAAAVFATGEVLFVIAAHFRRQARNVISPARQNFAYDWINALLTHLGVPKSAKPAEPPATAESAPMPLSGTPVARGS